MNNKRNAVRRPKRKNNILLKLCVATAAIMVVISIVVLLTVNGKDKPETAASASDTISKDTAQESSPQKNHLSGALYYNSLTVEEQAIYDAVTRAAKDLKSRTDVVNTTLSVERFEEIVRFVRADNPELFFIDFNSLVLEDGGDRCYVDMYYCVPAGDVPMMVDQLNEAITKALTTNDYLTAATELEKEIILHDRLLADCTGADGDDILYNTAYGALVKKQAYCDGYACAMKLLLNKAGIEAYTVSGAAGGNPHMWDLVRIDGEFYHLDPLWNDANLNFPADMRFHGYFNLSDDAIRRDHTIDFTDILPRATTDNDYYKATGLYAATLSDTSDIFASELKKAAAQKREYIEICCEESSNNEELGKHLIPAIHAYNESNGNTFSDIFRVYPASDTSRAVTIQLFYGSF